MRRSTNFRLFLKYIVSWMKLMVVHRYAVLNEASLHHFAYAGHTDNDRETLCSPSAVCRWYCSPEIITLSQ